VLLYVLSMDYYSTIKMNKLGVFGDDGTGV
jgi:hypothetical protein